MFEIVLIGLMLGPIVLFGALRLMLDELEGTSRVDDHLPRDNRMPMPLLGSASAVTGAPIAVRTQQYDKELM